jgi:nucleoside recognition membrane protein YjiH
MSRPVVSVLYVVVMVALIVGLDLAFLRDYFWARLAVNVGIVLVFGGFYLRFLNGSS